MKTRILAALAALTLFAGTASASLIQGEIGFTGIFAPNSTPLSTATAISSFSNVSVLVTTGDFSGQGLEGAITFAPFVFDPLPGAVTLWSKSGFSFDLESVNIAVRDNVSLKLIGSGTLAGASFDPTPGEFVFTGNTLGATFTFSATNAGVPEPTSLLVWGGLAMAGVAVSRRRR